MALKLRVPMSSPHLVLEAPLAPSGQPLPATPQSEFTDSDGGVFGVRFFDLLPSQSRVYLVSPSSKFVWDTKSAIAPDFKNQGAVRGHLGFHAAWPCDLKRWTESQIDHHLCDVKALVKGSGDLVLGEVGWRSEKLEILSVQSLKSEKIVAAYDVTGICSEPKNTEASVQIEWLVQDPEAFAHPRIRRKVWVAGLTE